MSEPLELVNPLLLYSAESASLGSPELEMHKTTHSRPGPLRNDQVYILDRPWSSDEARKVAERQPISMSISTNEDPWFVPEIEGLLRLVVSPLDGSTADDSSAFENPSIREMDLVSDGCKAPLKADHSNSIEYLAVSDRKGLGSLAAHPSLESLRISLNSSRRIEWLSKNQALKALELGVSRGPGISMEFAPEVPNLRHLIVSRVGKLDGVEALGDLRSLDVTLTQPVHEALSPLAHCKNLNWIRVSARGAIDFSALSYCRDLETLMIDVDDSLANHGLDLKAVLSLPKLSHIHVNTRKIPRGFESIPPEGLPLTVKVFPGGGSKIDLNIFSGPQRRIRSLVIGGKSEHRRALAELSELKRLMSPAAEGGWLYEDSFIDIDGVESEGRRWTRTDLTYS